MSSLYLCRKVLVLASSPYLCTRGYSWRSRLISAPRANLCACLCEYCAYLILRIFVRKGLANPLLAYLSTKRLTLASSLYFCKEFSLGVVALFVHTKGLVFALSPYLCTNVCPKGLARRPPICPQMCWLWRRRPICVQWANPLRTFNISAI